MFPMLPQGFSFLKNLFERLCSTSSVHWKKHHSVYKQKMNEFLFAKEMHGSVLNEFWRVFCLICTVYLEGWAVYCENGPFPCFPMTVWILSSDNLLSFLVHSNESDCFFHSAAAVATLLEGRLMKKQSDSFFVHQKTQKVVWLENPNSHCSARKWSIFTVHCSTFQVHSAK